MAVMIGAIEPIHEKRHPGGAALEESDAQFWKALEDAVSEHSRCLNHEAEGMPEGMSWIVGAEGVETHMVKTTHVHGQGAAEFFGFFIEGPVDLFSEVSLNGFAVRRQHAAEHPEFFDGAAQLGNTGSQHSEKESMPHL